MRKITLPSITALASLAGAAIAQTAEHDPAWRACFLCSQAMPVRTDEAAQTGYLAV